MAARMPVANDISSVPALGGDLIARYAGFRSHLADAKSTRVDEIARKTAADADGGAADGRRQTVENADGGRR
jgi:hypothetical protein